MVPFYLKQEKAMDNRPPLITVGELMKQLSVFSPNAEIDFSGLDFYRLKSRGTNLVQLEFNQQVYRDDKGNVSAHNLE